MTYAANDVTVRFGAATALDAVSFAIEAGQLVAVAGPNGGGKTTLLRVLLGLVKPDAGTASLNGRDITSWTRRDLARTVGALPQREEPAFPMSVAEAVLLGRWAALGPLSGVTAADNRLVMTALDRCDLQGFEDRTIDTLSGGEWQRVRLARALVAEPRWLLLDEPTTSLDLGHEMQLFELLRVLADSGIGVLAITHDLNLASLYADRLVLLHHGRVAAAGTPAQVMQADLLSTVFGWPVRVFDGPAGPQLTALRQSASPSSIGRIV